MTDRELRESCYEANVAIQKHGLVILTWGNVSACDRSRGLMAIKPSGVSYDHLSPQNMVFVDLGSGRVMGNSSMKPSSDTPTHLELYRAFEGVRGVVHTHSTHATVWAQAGHDLPCFGTTHADHFHGAVPCTEALTDAEISGSAGYERNTGTVIIREFQRRKLEPLHTPAVLVREHGPFCWGETVRSAVENAVALEAVACMALHTLQLNPETAQIRPALLDKHFLRKHGAGAYYGQPRPASR